MECVVLGYGGMMPMPLRLTTSVLVRREGKMMMFDAGEGIQLALKRGGLGISALDTIAVSHLHADHVLGLPGIMMFRAQNENPAPLNIIGPPGIMNFVNHTLKDLRYRINYDLLFQEWGNDVQTVKWNWNGAILTAKPLEHSTFCLGYRLEENPRPGKFNVEKARDLKIAPGFLYSRLQNGEKITLDDGRTILPVDVLGPPRKGRIIAFATDTIPCSGLIDTIRNADLAFIEGMFDEKHEKEAKRKLHMTASQAGMAAKSAGAKKIVLVHISPRYSIEEENALLKQAKKHFTNAKMAKALKKYPVSFAQVEGSEPST